MKVRDMIKALEKYDLDAPVFIHTNLYVTRVDDGGEAYKDGKPTGKVNCVILDTAVCDPFTMKGWEDWNPAVDG